MECLESKEIINNTFVKVRDVSFSEKKLRVPTEDEINNFLDNILELQKLVNDKTEKINIVNESLEKINMP